MDLSTLFIDSQTKKGSPKANKTNSDITLICATQSGMTQLPIFRSYGINYFLLVQKGIGLRLSKAARQIRSDLKKT
jgi:hypothetical protein